MELGKDIENSVIEDKISAQKPNQCALLVYTVRAGKKIKIVTAWNRNLEEFIWTSV